MKIKIPLILFLICLFFTSCNTHIDEKKYSYPNNLTISDIKGNPNDSSKFYYPAIFIHDSQTIKLDINAFQLNWFSKTLFVFKEPVLYNFYLGHDIYRFLWLRSFHRPVVFTLNKDNGKIWLTTKMLNKQAVLFEAMPEVNQNGDSVHYIDYYGKIDRQAEITYNQITELSDKEWNRFETLLDSCSFWETPFKTIYQIDGADWIIEGQLKNNYWFTNLNMGGPGQYLIQLSGLKEKIY